MIPYFFPILAILFSPQIEEKEKKELHNNAERALGQKDYGEAKKSYTELLKKLDTNNTDWRTYTDIVLRAAETHFLLKEYEEGANMLMMLLEQRPPPPFLPSIVTLFAKICSAQEKANQGYLKMKEILPLAPLATWKAEERTFFHACEYTLNSFHENLLQKGKHFLAVGAYKEAIDVYEKILQGIEKSYFPDASLDPIIKKKVHFHLAESYFQKARPEERPLSEKLFLTVDFYKKKKDYEKTLLSSDNISSPYLESALFEMGHFYFRADNWPQAKEYFLKLREIPHTSRPILLAALYLGRIYLNENREDEAEKHLSFVQKHMPSSDPLYFEACYWLGEVSYQKKAFALAISFFETSLTPLGSKGEWIRSAFYKLALSYIHSAHNVHVLEKHLLHEKAEKLLEKLFSYPFEEKIVFALADLYLLQREEKKMQSLFQRWQTSLSLDGQLEAMLYLSFLKMNFEEKETIFKKVTPEKYAQAKNYLKYLYYYAIHYIEKGAFDAHPEKYFCKAIDYLEQVIFTPERENMLFQKDTLSSVYTLLKYLDSGPKTEQRAYLMGLLYAYIEHPETEKALTAVYNDYPQGKHASSALFALGSFYDKKKECHLAKSIFQTLSEQYPTCFYADQAYLKCYNFEDYKKGEEMALNHLRSSLVMYPSSNYRAIASFFLGCHEPSYPLAKATLENALHAFDNYLKHHTNSTFLYFRYCTCVELALLESRFSHDVSETLDSLFNIVKELKEKSHPLRNYALYHNLLEASEFTLFQLYLKSHQESLAFETLLSMLSHYNETDMSARHYLPRVWKELGSLAYQAKDIQTAFFCYGIADECK